MRKAWEYKTIVGSTLARPVFDGELNAAGSEGWEAVSMTTLMGHDNVTGASYLHFTVLLKRPVE